MRDHLLGCRQTIPDVEAEAASQTNSCRPWPQPYALGIPTQVIEANREKYSQPLDTSVKDFECGDHPLSGMKQEDFPHEYDLRTMLGDEAVRYYKELVNPYCFVNADPGAACGDMTGTFTVDMTKRKCDDLNRKVQEILGSPRLLEPAQTITGIALASRIDQVNRACEAKRRDILAQARQRLNSDIQFWAGGGGGAGGR